MSVILEVDTRESDNLNWLNHLKFDGKIAAVTIKAGDTSTLPILSVHRGEELVILETEDWESRFSNNYAVEVRYTDGYCNYEHRLYRPGSVTGLTVTSSKIDKLPLFEGAYIKSYTKFNSEARTADTLSATHNYARSDTWYGCYLKGNIMRQQNFNDEALEWYHQADTIRPNRLEVVLAIYKLDRSTPISKIVDALESPDLPYHLPSKIELQRLVRSN